METNQNLNVDEVRQNLTEAVKDRRTSYAKTAGFSAIPIVATAAVVGLSELLTYQLQNHDVKVLVSNGICFGAGALAGLTGMVSEYVETFRDFVGNIRDSSQRVKAYQGQLKSLETRTQ